MSKRIVITVFILFSINIFSQGGKSLDIEFDSFGKENNGVGVTSSAINVKLPVKFYKGVLINSFSYLQNDLNYGSTILMNTSSLENFKTIKYSLSYMQRLNNKWAYKVIASPTISSNFKSNLTRDDMVFNGGLIFSKSYLKSKLNFGLIYNTAMGYNRPMPFVSYSGLINNRLSYSLGFPLTRVDYKINERNTVNFHVKPKGFYSNISDNLVLDTSNMAKKIKYQSFITGVNYMHTIDDYWKVSLNLGYQLSSNYDLLDKNDKSVYSIDTKNGVYLGVNLKFNLL